MNYLDKLPKHKYGWLPTLYSLVFHLRPKTIIEFGTAYGGTAITMGLALLDLYEQFNHVGKIHTYDTFGKESKGHIGSSPNFELALYNIQKYPISVSPYIEVGQKCFYEFNNDPTKSYDLLYFDIDNDGDKVLEMYLGNKSLIDNGSVVIFEGGSTIRDNVKWMIEKNKTKFNEIKQQVPFKLLTQDTEKYSCSILYNSNLYQLEL